MSILNSLRITSQKMNIWCNRSGSCPLLFRWRIFDKYYSYRDLQYKIWQKFDTRVTRKHRIKYTYFVSLRIIPLRLMENCCAHKMCVSSTAFFQACFAPIIIRPVTGEWFASCAQKCMRSRRRPILTSVGVCSWQILIIRSFQTSWIPSDGSPIVHYVRTDRHTDVANLIGFSTFCLRMRL